jgi:hypothetical protein
MQQKLWKLHLMTQIVHNNYKKLPLLRNTTTTGDKLTAERDSLITTAKLSNK